MMCFGDKHKRTATPPPRPMAPVAVQAAKAAPSRAAPPAKLTKPRPQPRPATPPEEKALMDITWPLVRPDTELPERVFSPLPPAPLELEIQAPRPFRYDDHRVAPSNSPSLYSLPNHSRPTSVEESLFDFHPRRSAWRCPSPPPLCPPTPSSMGESLRMASLTPAPLQMAPQSMPQRMRRAPTPPVPRLNIPVQSIQSTLPRNISPAFGTGSPTAGARSSPTPRKKNASPPPKSASPSGKSSKQPPSRTVALAGARRSPPPAAAERVAAAALQRARSLSSAMRPKFSLPETLAPFSLAPPPIVMDLYEPPTPARASPVDRPPPVVPERTAPLERVLSPGRIAAVDLDEDVFDDPLPSPAGSAELAYEKIKLFPIPDSIIRGEEIYQAERRRKQQEEARRSSEGSSSSSSGRSGRSHERRKSNESKHSQQSSSRSSQKSSSVESASAFDSRCPSPVSMRPASVALGQLSSRFSMSSLGSTLRVNQTASAAQAGFSLVRPASARPAPRGAPAAFASTGMVTTTVVGGLGTAGDRNNIGAIPTFPSRHEAKKARKQWLVEQEEAKRQSAKMGVEGILGWDATTRRWVNKMTDAEKEAWLNQWKEKRSAQQALHRRSSNSYVAHRHHGHHAPPVHSPPRPIFV